MVPQAMEVKLFDLTHPADSTVNDPRAYGFTPAIGHQRRAWELLHRRGQHQGQLARDRYGRTAALGLQRC
jgi:hypothetical protein